MKKRGFTLMEVIVAVGIIGVVAAIATPLLNNLIPDREKIAVLKAYKTICDINAEIQEDRAIWQNTPIANAGGWRHLINGNYPEVVIEQFDIVNGSRQPSARGLRFNTNDGHTWTVEDPDPGYGTIVVDLNDEKRNHCTYNSNNCTKPGQFRFLINSEDLNIKPGDPLTAAYLANSGKLNDKKADYKTAKADRKNYSEYPGN